MKKLLFLIVLASNIFAASINIAVAANVSYAIPTLIKEFNKLYPNIKVNTTIGSSGKLTAQIFYGARYDLFLSANMLYPNRLYKKGFTLTKPKIYAKGSLVLFSIYSSYDLSKGLDILKDNDIKKIAIANPLTAPYGVAAKEALEKVNLYSKLQDKFIYGESIAQTVFYTLKAASIGIIAKSVLYNKSMEKYKKGINYIDIDSSLYTPIAQGMVILKATQDRKITKLFYDFILSDSGKDILDSYGYITK